MKTLAIAAALALVAPLAATAAYADAPAVKAGKTLRDASNIRLGRIDKVNEDGSVRIIYDSRFVTVPADKVVVAENGDASTTLTKREVSKLR